MAWYGPDEVDDDPPPPAGATDSERLNWPRAHADRPDSYAYGDDDADPNAGVDSW